ncbi:MAG: hypothetical protein IV093_05925 [Rubrivivax sp.]|nr:hypothetical protein [Rubrivivax sp.]
MKTRTTLMLMAALPMGAWAHPGHGEPAAVHWHAHDAWGWALGLAVAAVLFWLARRK